MNDVSGKNSIVIGSDNVCTHDNCILIGNNLKSYDNDLFVIGTEEWNEYILLTDSEQKLIKDILMNAMKGKE